MKVLMFICLPPGIQDIGDLASSAEHTPRYPTQTIVDCQSYIQAWLGARGLGSPKDNPVPPPPLARGGWSDLSLACIIVLLIQLPAFESAYF